MPTLRRMRLGTPTLSGVVQDQIRGALHHGVKRALAVIHSGFQYDIGLVVDSFVSDPDKTDEENQEICLGLIKVADEPRGQLMRLFELR